MSWHKRGSKYDVYCYRASVGKKVYVGRRALERDARVLFREKTDEFAREAGKATTEALKVRDYAAEWLKDNHGPGTKRPVATTLQVNRTNLAPFLGCLPDCKEDHDHVEGFGDRPLDGGISRREALNWSKTRRHNAKSVSAMFNDAIDEELAKQNPFANRKQEQSRERKDISPLTEAEVDALADIALRHWGTDGYGITARAWVLFGAWVGDRPGETFGVELKDLNFTDGIATIRRVKKRGKTYPVDKVAFPQAARDAIRAMPELPKMGPIFLTVTGKPMVKGSLRYHWAPIRDAFREKVGEDRWRELIDFEDGHDKTLDFYSLRHFCASVMADRGASEYDISAQLGNSVEVCRESYIHGYRERQLERNRLLLERPAVVDLASRRKGA